MIPPHYLELVADAALKSYWRRRALGTLLRRCGVSATFLAGWAQEETKREFLYRLFPRLEASGIAGLQLVNRMADSLIQQTSFPDLSGWEDSEQKCLDAKAAVDALRTYRSAQQTEAATDREKAQTRQRAAEINAEIQARKLDLDKLSAELKELSKSLGTTRAGYDFEQWFYRLADYFEVINRRPYVVDGRQIDGSITADGTTYLVELKFTATQTGAPSIDVFHRKVSTKADNTMGVMFSMSGFSPVAIKDASGPKGVLLLFEHSHIYMLLQGGCSMDELVRRVRRHSSQTGEAYLATRQLYS